MSCHHIIAQNCNISLLGLSCLDAIDLWTWLSRGQWGLVVQHIARARNHLQGGMLLVKGTLLA